MPRPEFVYVTYIGTTPEKLWEALTDSAFSRSYWFGTELRTDWTVADKLLDGISKGWPAILSSLKSLLETGTALAIPISALGIEGH
ncbi:MAG: hypothetical protein JOY90_05490 [Bradyrhizobium sp.]|uniref:hypothetical protein n=1 Tax=Bradyrhizobium sp. TaxID=376 RepID=UPI001D26340D|nr:hypothetical protein [Bradyrhizobium sp.]MBV9559902.1 hypothetical protein [Bradyrhizobium sp.]